MAEGDIRILSGAYGVVELDAEDRDTSGIPQLQFGEPVKRGGTGGNFATRLQNADPEIGTDIFLGIVNRASTETATADGKVDVELVGPATKLFGDATTAANVDTAAELLGIMLDYVAFDVSATSVYTIDEDQGDDPNQNGLVILGGDTSRSKLIVGVHTNVTLFGSRVGDTIP